jgi:hypothetical protein
MVAAYNPFIVQGMRQRKLLKSQENEFAQEQAAKKQTQDIEISGRLAMSIRDASPENKQAAYQQAIETATQYGIDLQGMPTEYSKEADPMLTSLIAASGIEKQASPKGEFGYAMSIIQSPEFKEMSSEDQRRYIDFANTKAKGMENVFGQAQASAAGKGQAELGYKPELAARETTAKETAKFTAGSQEELKNMESKMPELMGAVDELRVLGREATYKQSGRAIDAVARELGKTTPGMIARTEYVSKIDNLVLPLLRDTFGAAFTEKEGETLKKTLGDVNKSPAEKESALNAFIQQKKRNIASQRRKLGIKDKKEIRR